MQEHSLETIQFELATLVRYITSVTPDKRNSDLDRSGYLLLHNISFCGSAGVKTLAKEYHLDISTVSRQAAALESKGYVYKVPDPLDKRAYFYQITESGKVELEKYKQERVEKLKGLINGWSDEERQQFGKLLNKFNQAFANKD
ncbi:MarR family transcriptional regulator [Bacillus sp. FJAT-49736]|uniref:MarR family winged helix-turn-helix transcriptional regulator n=1 Tax=Bacillus sp. FJAT-49736 TaxID=2833582 RepID=UPI001BC90000|nr:MarR family transcriptional regulator [Bacillus sp. FJAT-49736]MBS4175280.1 MarR family transcriptional regulator [Bacillus sp. FJAT-49736]